MNKRILWLAIFVMASLGIAEALYAADKTLAFMWIGNVDERIGRITKAAMPSRIATGFMRKMREIAPEVGVDLHRDIRSQEEAERLFRMHESKGNAVVFLRSEGAQFLAKTNPKVPCFVGSCNDPSQLGVIKNLVAPEGNITGVTCYIPYQKRFEVIKALFPAAKSVALIVERGHPGGPIDQQGTREECRKLGLDYSEVVAGNVADLVEGAQRSWERLTSSYCRTLPWSWTTP